MVFSPLFRISYDLQKGTDNFSPSLLLDGIREKWREKQVAGLETDRPLSAKRLVATS